MRSFTAVVEFDPETKLYVGLVPGLPGAHTQDELRENLKEVVEHCLEEFEGDPADLPSFVGTQQIVVA